MTRDDPDGPANPTRAEPPIEQLPTEAVMPRVVASFLDDLLDATRFRAEEPENGLLTEGARAVRRIGAAVNTTFRAIEGADRAGVDLLLVHHPSWPSIDLQLHERKMDRLRELGIALYGAHASLDAVPVIGTGDSLARLVGLTVEGRFAQYHGAPAGIHGRWQGTLATLVQAVTAAIGGEPEVHANSERCERVAMLTGAGWLTSWLEEAIALGCDTYLTGEGTMYTRLFAREAGVNLVLGGHFRTEAPGIAALAGRAAEQFGVAWLFIDDEPIG